MTNNTIPNVPRELLADLLGNDHDKRIMAERHLLAMLANAPSPAGVGGWDVAGDILEKLSAAQLEIDQHAKRIGELEGLLREAHDTYRAAIHWEDLRGTMKRIDAAMSAGKDSVS